MANINFQQRGLDGITSKLDGLSAGLNGAGGGFRTLKATGVGAIRALGVAIRANPIGFIIGAIVTVVIALTSQLRKLQPVIDVIDQGFAALGAAADFVTNRIGAFFGIVERTELGLLDTVRAAIMLKDAEQALEVATIANITASAMRNQMLQAQRLIAADVTAGEEERIAALERAQEIVQENFDAEAMLLEARIANLASTQVLGDDINEDTRELAMLQAELINLDSMRSAGLIELQGTLGGLQLAQQAKIDADNAERQALIDKDIEEKRVSDEATRETRQQREIDLLVAAGDTDEEIFTARLARAETEDQRAEILHERAVFRIEAGVQAEVDRVAREKVLSTEAIAQAALEEMTKTELANAEADAKAAALDATAQALTNLSVIAGQETVAGKALAVAASLINTYQGITKALAQGGTAGIVGAIAVGAAGFAAVAEIISTDVPTSNGASSSVGAGGARAIPQSTLAPATLNQINSPLLGVEGGTTNLLATDTNNNAPSNTTFSPNTLSTAEEQMRDSQSRQNTFRS